MEDTPLELDSNFLQKLKKKYNHKTENYTDSKDSNTIYTKEQYKKIISDFIIFAIIVWILTEYDIKLLENKIYDKILKILISFISYKFISSFDF